MEASYVPQIVRLARVGRAEQLSAFFPALNLSGRLAALAYSILIGQSVFGVGFFFGALLRGFLLAQILVLKRRALRLREAEGEQSHGLDGSAEGGPSRMVRA